MVSGAVWAQIVCCGSRRKQQPASTELRDVSASTNQAEPKSQRASTNNVFDIDRDQGSVHGSIGFSSGSYAVLPETSIRVLCLNPASELSSTLSGELVTIPRVESINAYDALSYAWDGAFSDEPLPDDEIMLGNTGVNITGNLGHALRRLRGTVQTRILWTDAICIDQGNDDEKSVQVQHMSTVYSNARQVIAWLGEDSPVQDGEAVLHCAERSFQDQPLVPNDEGALAACRGATKFWTRRYFSRKWIIQENVLAQSLIVVCGSNSVEWATTCDFRIWARQLHTALEPGGEHRLDPKRLNGQYWRAPDASSLDNVLVGYHPLQCRDERDHIYALLSLIQHDSRIQVDYTLPFTTVYHKFMQSVIQDICPAYTVQNFRVIYRLLCVAAAHAEQDVKGCREIGFPTWVPNWIFWVPGHDAEIFEGCENPNIFMDYYAGLAEGDVGQYLMLVIEQYEPVSGLLSPGVNIDPINNPYCAPYVPDALDCVVGPRLADVHNKLGQYINAIGGCLLLRPFLMDSEGVYSYNLVGTCTLKTMPGLFRSRRATFKIM